MSRESSGGKCRWVLTGWLLAIAATGACKKDEPGTDSTEGEICLTDAECGGDARCATLPGYEAGMCAASCASGLSCGNDVCVTGLSPGPSCLQHCRYSAECAAGFACALVDPDLAVCVPVSWTGTGGIGGTGVGGAAGAGGYSGSGGYWSGGTGGTGIAGAAGTGGYSGSGGYWSGGTGGTGIAGAAGAGGYSGSGGYWSGGTGGTGIAGAAGFPGFGP